jgi:hypothetical protein
VSESCTPNTPHDRAPYPPDHPANTLERRRLDDALVDRRTWVRLVELGEQRGAYRRRRVLYRMLTFLAFYADEAGFVRELTKLEICYAERFYGGARANGRARFYDHLAAARATGYIMQTGYPSQTGRAVYRLTFALTQLPRDLPLDLAMHLRVDERWLDQEAGLAPAAEYGPSAAAAAAGTVPPPRTPVEIHDPAAAAKARFDTLEPWLDDTYLVAVAMRVEQQTAQLQGREYDEAAAEARARAQLQADAGDVEDYEVVDERDLHAVAAFDTVKPQPRALILENPDTWPYSREGSFPLGLLTHYWLDLRKQGEKQKRPPTARTFEVGPAERRRAAALVRSKIWFAWHEWAQADPSRRRPLSQGQWEDLTCTIALALRRTNASCVVEEATRSLGSARDLAAVVGSRLWALVRFGPEWPDWAEYRRTLMRGAEPSWNLPTPPGVVGPASARAALRRARGGLERVGTQLALYPGAVDPGRYADQARRSLGTAAFGLERYRYGQVVPDTARPSLIDSLIASGAAARSVAAATPPSVDPRQRTALEAEQAAHRAKRAAERAENLARAKALAKASRRERGK